MAIEIYRGNDVVATIPAGPNLTFSHGLMNQHKIVASDLKGFDPLSVQIEDYINYKGVKFKINTVPQIKADHQLTYEITFEGPKYTWHDKLFMHEGAAEFHQYGNVLLFMQVFLSNINEIDPGWTLGVVEVTNEKHLTFSNITCHEAIILIAEAFGLEYDSDDKVITMIPKIGRDTGLVFEYGMGKGLYEITRSYVSNKNVVTKVYGFGGSRNLPLGYRGTMKRLTFDSGYKAKNTELYGIKEGQYTNNDIYPQRVATATAVNNVGGIFKITDTTLDFDINNLRLSNDLDPKISFIDGRLAGEEFVITKYDPVTKTITYKGFVNSNNFLVPGETNIANVGDKYILHDIKMPDTYVKAAELRIDQETEKYTLENSVPKVEYSGTIDPLHLRDNQIGLKPGDRVNFKDGRIGLNDTIRITEISYPLDFPDFVSSGTRIEVKIANFVTYSAQQRLRDEKLIVRHEVKEIDLRNVEQARRNNANLLNLRDLVIDPEGNYYTDKIKPGSIETLYLSVGAKATNFSLKNIAFKVNSGGNPSVFTATAGQLVHFGINIPGAGFVWEMQSFSITGLSNTVTYYLYAKVSRVTLVGSWELSTDIRTYESVPGFFSLQTGVLFPVRDGYRNYELTKGMAFMVGDQITAGVLKSLDGQNFFNLTDGKFNLGDAENGINFNLDGLGTTNFAGNVNIKGGITAGALKVGDEAGINNAGISGTIDSGDKSVWLWGGATYANRDVAPFRALQDGTVFMKKARISGDIVIGFQSEIVAPGGPNNPAVYTSGWTLSSSAVLNDASAVGVSGGNNFALIRASSKYENNKETEFAFSTNLIPDYFGGQYAQTAYIRNKRPKLGVPGWGDDTTNIALELHAEGANNNTALLINKGDFQLNDGNMKIGNSVGINGTWDVRMGGGHFWAMTWEKGLLVNAQDKGD